MKRRGLRSPIVVAGSVAVIIVALVAWWFWPNREARQDVASAKRGLIKEVKPAAVQNTVTPKPGWVVSTNKFGQVHEHPATNAWGNPWSWGPKKLHPAYTSRIDRASQPLYMQVFRNSADRAIAALLTIEPGTPLIGGDEPAPGIRNAFERALNDPVLVLHDDSDEVKELKRAVNATKADLKARIDAGEDLVKILTDSRRELRELGAYREELRKQIDQFFYKRDTKPEDLKDMVDAANLMLNERGLKNLSVPEIYYKNLETRIRIRKAREANEQ